MGLAEKRECNWIILSVLFFGSNVFKICSISVLAFLISINGLVLLSFSKSLYRRYQAYRAI